MKLRKSPLSFRIPLIYFLISSLWILFSDIILSISTPQPENLSSAQTYKGWFFIVITTWVLHIILRANEKREAEARIKADEKYQELVERLPAVVFMDSFDEKQSTLYMSPKLIDLLGYTPEEWKEDDTIWERSLHPKDRERVLQEDIRSSAMLETFRIEYRIRHRDGHYIWVKEDSSLIRDKEGKPSHWHGILLDITEQKQAEDALRHHDEIIKAVGFSAAQFLKSIDWEINVGEVLERLGHATDASRVYIFKREQFSTISQIFEWCNEGIPSQIDTIELQKFDLLSSGYSRWQIFFDEGKAIYGLISDFPPSEQALLQIKGSLSLICIPIKTGEGWWGCIGFDDCQGGREWTGSEIEALQTAASTLGAAIERKQSVEALQSSEASYRGLFNTVQDAIYIQDNMGNFLDVNDGALQMYGYPKERFIGNSPDFLSAPGRNNMDALVRSIAAAFEGTPQEFEFWGLRSNGEIFPKEVHLFKGMYFGQEAIIAVAQDITARKQYEEALFKQVRELSVLHSIALVESNAKTVDELIQLSTNLISDSLYSDMCGVFLLSESQDMLSPHFSYRGTEAINTLESLPVTTGIFGEAAITKHSCRVGDVSLSPYYFELSPTTRSQLCIPLVSGSKVLGVLNVESKIPYAFTEKDEKLLSTIAGGMASAMERIQLAELEKNRLQQAEILRNATMELTSYFEADKLFEKIFNLLEELLPYDSASIETIEGEDSFKITAGRRIPPDLIGTTYKSDMEKWNGLGAFRDPIIIPDVHQDERFILFEQTKHIHSWMGIPLLTQGKLIGVLNLDSRTPGFFKNEHAALAQTFANQVANSLENLRLFENEQQRRRVAETLSQATSSLANILDLNQLLDSILDWLNKVIPYDSASIMLNEEKTLKLVAQRNLPNSFHIGDEIHVTAKWNQISSEKDVLLIFDAQEDDLFEKWPGSEYIHGWMTMAMYSQNSLIGFLNLDSRTPGAFTEEHATIARTFTNQVATAIEKARLNNETRQRLEELEMVSRVSYQLRAARETKDMLPILLDEIKSSIGTEEAAIWLFDPKKNILVPQAAGGKLSEIPKKEFTPLEGIVGQVYSSGDIHLSPEYSSDPVANLENVKYIGEGWNSIAVPIRTTAAVIGVLVVGIKSPRKVEVHHQNLLLTLAEIAGNAIYRSNLYERSEEQIRRLTTLREMDAAISSSLDLRITLNIITDHLVSKMGAKAAAILVFNPNSQMLDFYAAQGFRNRETSRTSISIGEGFIGRILLNRRPIHMEDLGAEGDNSYFSFLSNENLTGYYAIPLFSKGAVRGILETYFAQPFSFTQDWQDFVQTLAGQATIAIDNTQLFENLQRTNQELSLAYDTTLEGWGKALELRDKETQGHTKRVTDLTLELARQMGIPEAELTQIRRGTLLHDIGKMGVPDSILHKPGPLNDEEMIEMKRHPQYAYDLLLSIPYLRPALEIPYYHHEWWNGNGYPQGVSGEDIPLPARIFAIVDVWDALLSDRPYRTAWPEEKVMEYIIDLAGKQFDPNVVAAFQRMFENRIKFIESNLSGQKGS